MIHALAWPIAAVLVAANVRRTVAAILLYRMSRKP